ncbi:hypothetical protein KI387_010797, partial [Taxus chinensis]
ETKKFTLRLQVYKPSIHNGDNIVPKTLKFWTSEFQTLSLNFWHNSQGLRRKEVEAMGDKLKLIEAQKYSFVGDSIYTIPKGLQ